MWEWYRLLSPAPCFCAPVQSCCPLLDSCGNVPFLSQTINVSHEIFHKSINELDPPFSSVTWIICNVCFSYRHAYIVSCVLFLVLHPPYSCWSTCIREGHSFSLGIRIWLCATVRISCRLLKGVSTVFWQLYRFCRGVCVFSSTSASVAHIHNCAAPSSCGAKTAHACLFEPHGRMARHKGVRMWGFAVSLSLSLSGLVAGGWMGDKIGRYRERINYR